MSACISFHVYEPRSKAVWSSTRLGEEASAAAAAMVGRGEKERERGEGNGERSQSTTDGAEDGTEGGGCLLRGQRAGVSPSGACSTDSSPLHRNARAHRAPSTT